MKQLFSRWMSSTIFLLFIASCSKEELALSPPDDTGNNRPATVIRLTADNWSTDRNGNYVNNFLGVIPSHMETSTARVYVLTDEPKEELISYGAVSFMGGQLWSTRSGYDIKITFKPEVPFGIKPFEALNIKVVLR